MTTVYQLDNLIEGFKLSCQTEGKSPRTVEWYTSFLLRFLRFLEQNELPTQLDRIEKSHIRQFILHLQQEARTPRTNKPLSGVLVFACHFAFPGIGHIVRDKDMFAWQPV